MHPASLEVANEFLEIQNYLNMMLLLLVVLAVTGCAQIAGEHNFTLTGSETELGPLFRFSNNAVLEKGTFAEGPVVMLCCNLIVEGNVSGDILLVSGNLRIDAYARVDGNINVVSGNMAR